MVKSWAFWKTEKEINKMAFNEVNLQTGFNVLNASPLKKLQVQIVSLPLVVFIHFLFDL